MKGMIWLFLVMLTPLFCINSSQRVPRKFCLDLFPGCLKSLGFIIWILEACHVMIFCLESFTCSSVREHLEFHFSRGVSEAIFCWSVELIVFEDFKPLNLMVSFRSENPKYSNYIVKLTNHFTTISTPNPVANCLY